MHTRVEDFLPLCPPSPFGLPPQMRCCQNLASRGIGTSLSSICLKDFSYLDEGFGLQREVSFEWTIHGDFEPIVMESLKKESLSNVLTPLMEGVNAVTRTAFHQPVGKAYLIRALKELNHSAEILYGYSTSEILGQNVVQLLVHKNYADFENELIDQLAQGHSWKGQLLFKKKSGDIFPALVTNTPLYNESGLFVGVIFVTDDARSLHGKATVIDNRSSLSSEGGDRASRNNEMGKSKVEFQQLFHFQHPIASKVSSAASKVTSKVRSWVHNGENVECEGGIHRGKCFEDVPHISQPSDHREYHNVNFNETKPFKDTRISFNSSISQHFTLFKKFRGTSESNTWNGGENKNVMRNTLGFKAETWMTKKGKVLNWGSECHVQEIKNRFEWPWRNLDKEKDPENHKENNSSYCRENYNNDMNKSRFSDCSILQLSNNAARVSRNGRISSINCRKTKSLETNLGTLDCEILWEDIRIGEYVGQGSSATVYHGLWYGSDIAIKVFHDCLNDFVDAFCKEVVMMKKLRHPNVLLFMGAITSPERLCIVTEYLPRGSLFQLLKRNMPGMNWRRRTRMTLNIARGVNYLHHCHPPIVHRDLKSSNLLVDKSWTVKVGDFGLSHLKNTTFLTTNSGKGTPQWMAPEVLRNEPSNEKSDVYSFGVIMWELATGKVPWDELNPMQVAFLSPPNFLSQTCSCTRAVGFRDQRLQIPESLDPQWTSIIEICWHSDLQCRPSFQELVERLRILDKSYSRPAS